MPAGGTHANCTWSLKVTDSDSLMRAISLLQERQKQSERERERKRLREAVILTSDFEIFLQRQKKEIERMLDTTSRTSKIFGFSFFLIVIMSKQINQLNGSFYLSNLSLWKKSGRIFEGQQNML